MMTGVICVYMRSGVMCSHCNLSYEPLSLMNTLKEKKGSQECSQSLPSGSRTDQDIPSILRHSLQLKRGSGLCVFRFAWLVSAVSCRSTGAWVDAPQAALFIHRMHGFPILKSQESEWKMLQEWCLILDSLWCISLAGWKPRTSQIPLNSQGWAAWYYMEKFVVFLGFSDKWPLFFRNTTWSYSRFTGSCPVRTTVSSKGSSQWNSWG